MIESTHAHRVVLTERKRLDLGGVKDVKSFDDGQVTLLTVMGEMVVTGEGLQVEKLDIESGDVILVGSIASVQYIQTQASANRGFFSRLFS